MSTTVGYSYLRTLLSLGTLPVIRPAVIRPVTRIQHLDSEVSIPSHLAPEPGDLIAHALFALKHEGTELSIIAAMSPHLPAQALLAALRRTPAGGYVRKLCFLWESFTGQELADLPANLGNNPYPLFNPKAYVTGPAVRNRRWAIDVNGLGDFSHCPTVRRTASVNACLTTDPLGEALAYLKGIGSTELDRVLAWAYLHETRSTYELEGESLPANKAEAFAAILRQAGEAHALTEEYLTDLQNAVVTNPLAREPAFRHTQNYLTNGAPGARGVSYVPPPAYLLASLLGTTDRLANRQICPDLDPLVRAALVSFGFVFAHPFGDGNGRLSRFLAHYALCQSGVFPNGFILPLSIAMKRNESQYLQALQSFSKPARDLWSVQWLDRDDFAFEFKGHESVYRFWDATPCVEFIYKMAEETLVCDLQGEVEYLHCYDAVLRETEERFDIPGSTLSKLIRMAHQQGGVLSLNRRKQFLYQVPPEAFDFIESAIRARIPPKSPG
jgi:hypothetical protein